MNRSFGLEALEERVLLSAQPVAAAGGGTPAASSANVVIEAHPAAFTGAQDLPQHSIASVDILPPVSHLETLAAPDQPAADDPSKSFLTGSPDSHVGGQSETSPNVRGLSAEIVVSSQLTPSLSSAPGLTDSITGIDKQGDGLLQALSTPDLPLGATITVNSSADSNVRDGFLTLREAILVNNRTLAVSALSSAEQSLVSGTPSSDDRDRIVFAIPGSGTQSIFVGEDGLPFVTDPVIIDGTTQFDSGAHLPLIEIDASSAGPNQLHFSAAGLEITAGNSKVLALIINGAPGDGIRLRSGGNNTLLGNYVGSFLGPNLADTSNIFGNKGSGIDILDSANNQIGGANPGDRNFISGNGGEGIVVENGGSTGNVIQGNYIGTDITGTKALPNKFQGVLVTALAGRSDYASGTLIGGDDPRFGNVISGNGHSGVEIVRGGGNTVKANYIGTAQNGFGHLGNGQDGVTIDDSPSNVIGGPNLAANVISSNVRYGLQINGSHAVGNVVQGNLIGTDVTGLAALGNLLDGIFLGQFTPDTALVPIDAPITGAPSFTTIGGLTENLRNYISGNQRDGIHVEGGAQNTTIDANYIGLQFDGLGALGNTRDGISIIDSKLTKIGDTILGGTSVNPRNVISSNTGYGIHISGTDSNPTVVAGNIIGLDASGTKPRGNGAGVFIDIGADGNTIGGGLALVNGQKQDRRNIISDNVFGVVIFGQNNTVLGNYIGTNLNGTAPIANKKGGIDVFTSNNTIGSDQNGLGNVISGNSVFGVRLEHGVSGNKIVGNFIGTDATGFSDVGNAGDGIVLDHASGNTIGGAAITVGFAPGNVISRNHGNGIFILGSAPNSLQNLIQGNIIGSDLLGSGLMPNTSNGVLVQESSNNIIGGSVTADQNVISGNNKAGILILKGDHNQILGNLVGTDSSGALPLADFNGIVISDSSNNTIGNITLAARNIISGNIGTGLDISGKGSYGNIVRGNYIGTNRDGSSEMSNSLDGILVEQGASGNTIGGAAPGQRNVISGNLKSGIHLVQVGIEQPVQNNLIQGNYIGVGADGVAKIGNNEHGVLIEDASHNTIGGATDGQGNIIAFNGSSLDQKGHGIEVASGKGNLISRNSIFENSGRGIDLNNDSFTLNHLGSDFRANESQNYPVAVFVTFSGTTKTVTYDLTADSNADYTVEFFSNDKPDPSGFGEGKKFLKSVAVHTDANGFVEFTVSFGGTDLLISATATDSENNTSEFSMVDTDGDGLADAWEDLDPQDGYSGGIDINEDGTLDYVLAAQTNTVGLEVNPYRKDVFVEVDAMIGFAPASGVLDAVEASFADAPAELVNNPSGAPGIALHATLDETNLPAMRFPNTTDTSWPEFDLLKKQYFGTPTIEERGEPGQPNPNWDIVRQAKLLVSRYAIFADSWGTSSSGGPLDSSGLSENFTRTAAGGSEIGLGGGDFMVTLGQWVRSYGPDGVAGGGDDVFGGSDNDQAATFMHELGHTLGLGHGGDQYEDSFNDKPNYHSVMNYLWQLPAPWMFEDPTGVGILNPSAQDINGNGSFDDSSWILDYSRSAYPTLDESNLNEQAGIDGDSRFWTSTGALDSHGKSQIVLETGPVDWNRDGDKNDTAISTPLDINLVVHPSDRVAGQVLDGYEDWSHLRFYFRDLPNAPEGKHPGDDSGVTLAEYQQSESYGTGPGYFAFSETNSFEVGENAGFATINILRMDGTTGTVSIDFNTSDGSALAGSDYSTTNGTLKFVDGEYLKSITVPITNDTLAEGAESFHVTLGHPTGGAAIANVASATISILDNDGPGKFQVSLPVYVANETDPTSLITVTRTEGAVGAASVSYNALDGTASAGKDYSLAAGTLNFANGETSETFSVNILDDSIVEGPETLTLKLSNPTSGATLGPLDSATLVINDVEAGVLQFSDPVFQVNENGGFATIIVTRTNGSDGLVSVGFSTSNGTANAADYTSTSGTLTLSSGQTVGVIKVPILEDNIAEPTESVNLTLAAPSGGATLGTIQAATLSILDDEPATIQFSSPSFSVNENAGSGAVQISRLGDLSETVVIDFATADGTAKAGVDYATASGTATFLAGDSVATFSVGVTDNSLGEGNRALQLLLTNPSANAVVGSPTATLTIVDDETVSASSFVVTNTNDSGAGSLRQALFSANAHPGIDLILFNIPGSGLHSIQPTSLLPSITGPVTINGYSQPGSSPNSLANGDNAVLQIEINGNGILSAGDNYILRILGGNSIVRGLVLNRVPAAAIVLDTNGGNFVQGNFIGTDSTGLLALGDSIGVRVLNSSNNVIGGITPDTRNLISANSQSGISIETTFTAGSPFKAQNNQILGNYIGTTISGSAPLGNGTGISVNANAGVPGGPLGTTIGGTTPGAGNIIAFNASNGIRILAGGGNSIRGNSIFSNDPSGQNSNFTAGLGIDLSTTSDFNFANAVTPNDPGDSDSGIQVLGPPTNIVLPGPNALQNYPDLSSAISSNGTLTVQGRLSSAANQTFQIDVYANDQIEPSGYGEGRAYLGAVSVTTDGAGHGQFTVSLAAPAASFRFITATATDSDGNTSEFSARLTVGDVLGSVFVVNTADDHDDGVADVNDTTLREAILAADNHTGLDTILFNIPGSGVQTIYPKSSLPPVTDAVTMDGYSQPGSSPNTLSIGFNGVLLIEISGRNNAKGLGSTIRGGLLLTGGGSTVRGLIINRMDSPLFLQGPWNNTVVGNILGADSTGFVQVSQNSSSLSAPLAIVGSSNNTIGSAAPADRNILAGVLLSTNANNNRLEGNYIGPNASGFGILSGFGGAEGLQIASSSNNTIGGPDAGQGNVISGNRGNAIILYGSSNANRIQGNYIGVAADGSAALGNGVPGSAAAGVFLADSASGNVIGGIEPGEGNVIAWNEGFGVILNSSGTQASPGGNSIRGNSIYSNGLSRSSEGGGLGIDLSGELYTSNSQVTINDNLDTDTGPNNLQNFPVLSSALSSNGQLTIQGRLNSTPHTTFQIDLYSSETFDPLGFGEGQHYLGSVTVVTDANGHIDFTAVLPVEVADGQFITATATDPGNNTSEFSARLTVGDVLGNLYVVTTPADYDDGVASPTDTTLREAILAANNHPGPDTILFNIPGTGVETISTFLPLPAITDPVTINGYSQPGAHPNTLAEGDDAVLMIQLIGTQLQNQSQIGLVLRGGNTLIQGLVLSGFDSGELDIEENGNNVIQGDFFGTDPTGTVSSNLAASDIRIFASSNNLIGGTTPAARNIVSGSLNAAIQISGFNGPATDPRVAFFATTGNTVQGNYIGTDRTGTIALGTSDGVHTGGLVVGASENNLIGGTQPGARNVIVGGGGVVLGGHAVAGLAAGNILQGNYIGTDRTGEVALGTRGVQLSGLGNIVGGTLPGAGNLISGSTGSGIFSFDFSNGISGGHIIQGNFIGTDKFGVLPLSNAGDGIELFDSNNMVGGTVPAAANVISGNLGNGILLSRAFNNEPPVSGTLIEGNLIGVAADGVSPLGNLGDGITVLDQTGFSSGATNDSIGAAVPGAANVIAYNGKNGVSVSSATRIAIRSNSIFSNGNLGIDLNNNGPTSNDSGDFDGGANNLQNFPVLTSVNNSGSSVAVQGTLNSQPSSIYTLEFFDNVAFDPSDFGEGQRLIGSATVTTDANGSATFNLNFPVSVPLDHVITSTATDSQGNTSEFSGRPASQPVGATVDLVTHLSVSPDPVLAGQALTYVITITNQGANPATNVTFLDSLPAGVTFTSVTFSKGIAGPFGSQRVFGSLGTIASGATATVHISVLPSNPGTITDTVVATSDQREQDPSNNSISVDSVVNPGADLSLLLESSVTDVVGQGRTVEFSLTITNHGPQTASGLTLTDTLPDSFTFESFDNFVGSQNGQVLTWDLGQLNPGSSTIVVFAAVPGQAGESTNHAQITALSADPNLANNIASIDISVAPVADLAIALSFVPSPAAAGQPLTYSLTVTNNGPSEANETVLTDTLPDNVTFNSASSNQGTFTFANGVATFDLGRLINSAVVTAQIVVVPNLSGTTLENLASVAATGTVDFLNDNSASVDTIVSAAYPAELYGAGISATGDEALYAIDPDSGSAAPVGPIGFVAVSGIDFDPKSGILYGTGNDPETNESVLITIDPHTGAGTVVGATHVEDLGGRNITDISFRHSDGVLFAYLSNRSLVTIDLTSGQASLVGSTSAAGNSGNGLAFSSDGTLFHGDQSDLDSLNPTTGLATLLETLTFPAPATSSPRLNALDFRPSTGVLYGSVRSGNDNYLATVALDTGNVTLIGLSVPNLDAIAFFPRATAVHQPPIATSDSYGGFEDTPINIAIGQGVLSNDSDPEGHSLSAILVAPPTHGTLTLAADGSFTYLPTVDYNGPDTFTYRANNGQSSNASSNLATVSLTITSVNDSPAGASGTVTLLENDSYVFSPADFGFTDVKDSPPNLFLALHLATLPNAGTLTDNGIAVSAGQLISLADLAAGNLRFTPVAHANGNAHASFTFQVQDDGGTAHGGVDLDSQPRTLTLNVTPVNDAPEAVNDDYSTNEDIALIVGVAQGILANDADIDSPNLTALLVTGPQHGALLLNLDGSFSYTPTADFNGADSFTYRANYGQTANNLSPLATVNLTVQSLNDAPSGSSRTVTLLEDGFYTFTTADFGFADPKDVPSNGFLAVEIATLPALGTLTDDGSVLSEGQFIPAADLDRGRLKFTSSAHSSGSPYASFTFQVQDDGGNANGGVDLDPKPRTLTLNVTSANAAPIAVNDNYVTNEDAPLNVNSSQGILANDSDLDNPDLTAALVTGPQHGTLLLNPDGSFTYTPATNFNGSDTFVYQANNGQSSNNLSNLTVVTLTLNPVNDTPHGAALTVTLPESSSYPFIPTDFGFSDANDTPANNLLAVRITTLPLVGTLTDNGNPVTAGQSISAADLNSGKLVFAPAPNARGIGYASFTFQVQDDGGTANGGIDLDPQPKVLTFDVTHVNEAPTAVNDNYTTDEDHQLDIAPGQGVLANDTDIDTPILTAALVSAPQHGHLVLNPDGSFTYSPDANFNGQDGFTYQANDGQSANSVSNTGTVSLTIHSVNDSPTGTTKTVTTAQETAYAFSLADFGFADPHDNPANQFLAVKITTLPSSGLLQNGGINLTAGQFVPTSDVSSGKLVFIPAANSSESPYTSFNFQVQDNGGTLNGGVDLDPSPKTLSVNVTPASPNLTVTDLAGRAKSGEVQLTWTYTGASLYDVYRRTSPEGPATLIGSIASTYSTYLDRTATNGVTYYYTVNSVLADGTESTASNLVIVTPNARSH